MESMTPTQYLEQLESGFVGAVEEYVLQGTYEYMGASNPFTGQLKVDSQGKVAGSMNDEVSVCDMHILEGQLIHKDGTLELTFVKLPDNAMMADIYYKMARVAEDVAMAGTYEGGWAFKLDAIHLRHLDGRAVSEVSNSAQMTLERRV